MYNMKQMLFFAVVSDGSPLMSAGSGMVDFVVSETAIFHSSQRFPKHSQQQGNRFSQAGKSF